MDQSGEMCMLGRMIFRHAEDAVAVDWAQMAPADKYNWLSDYYTKAMTFVPPEIRVEDPAAMDAAYGQIAAYPEGQPAPTTI